MARPIMLGVVGDSAAGKTTFTRGLVRILGESQVTHACTDDYHRFDRHQRSELGITPLHPDCNYIDILTQDLATLRSGGSILKPVYRHTDGTFGPPTYVSPRAFNVIEGLLGYHTQALRDSYDVRVYLAPPEDVRRQWKVQRDCSRRGYTTDQVLLELDRREPDSAAFIRPQERYADIVLSFMPGSSGDQSRLDAKLILRDGLIHPDLSPFSSRGGITVTNRDGDCHVHIPGDLAPDRAAEIEEALWEKLHFATHLRSQRLGEFSIGTQLHRSESLALAQLLVLYQLVTARAATALGGEGARARLRGAAIEESEETGSEAVPGEADIDTDTQPGVEAENETDDSVDAVTHS